MMLKENNMTDILLTASTQNQNTVINQNNSLYQIKIESNNDCVNKALNDKNFSFYNQYIKLKETYKELLNKHNSLDEKIKKAKILVGESNLQVDKILKKRVRRNKKNLISKFKCECCSKEYSSKSSLIFHKKMKHEEK